MELGTVLSVAQTLYGALQSSELKELCSVWGYESELENLGRKVSVVNAVLLDAESKREQAGLSHQAQLWVDELKDVVFDADDLLDEFVTLAEQKQLMDREGGNVFKKVRRFFSRSNPLLVALNMSRGIKDIKDRLDAIAGNHADFGFKLDCHPIRRRRDETCSYVYAKNIIGREQDKENIVNMLLDSNVDSVVSFLTIVGIGGLGKTSLAQLVYNDPRVEKGFSLRLWICVADEDQKRLDVKTILVKILQSATGQNHKELVGMTLECLQQKLQMQLAGTRYLLVLDDVWNEDRHQWGNLTRFFMCGILGSWVVVTSRSKMTAEAVGHGLIYELKGLSEEDSWRLFEMTAFEQEGCLQESAPPDLVKIGREIVRKCANVPLAIRVVGSLLYGHGRAKWQLFLEVGIGRIRRGEDGIEPLLRSSYLHLENPLRICFSYCALFPKGCVLEKDTLINLWMAQGYVIPLEEGQSLEDAAEEYFLILLRRCFFHDTEKDEYGETVSCKMHDLMHDIAQQISGKEIYTSSSITPNLDKKVRHLSDLTIGKDTELCLTMSKIRTYFRVDSLAIPMPIILNWTSLRVLDLSYSLIAMLPDAVSRLLHLRYLDLSGNPWIEVLPISALKLHNLQTLKLRGCHGLTRLAKDLGKLVNLRFLDLNGLNITHLPSSIGKLSRLVHLDLSGNDKLSALPDTVVELHNLRTLRMQCCDDLRGLPKDMKQLVKLRILDITGCWLLKGMPCGIGKLESLQVLPLFVVGERSDTGIVDTLEDLKALSNLNGHMGIRFNISENATYVKENDWQGEYLRNKQYLSHITLDFGESYMAVDCEEALLEDLQPHPNLKGLKLFGYCGKRMPSWARNCNLEARLPHLVKVHIVSCDGLQSLSSLGRLLHLKSLIVEDLCNLEYVENTSSSSSSGIEASNSEQESFFPSLEELKLEDLPKLKGWWSNTRQQCHASPSFPHLFHLHVWRCPNLSCMPLCPTVERLSLGKCSRRLRILESECRNSTLTTVYTEDVGCLNSALSVETFRCLGQMEIRHDEEVRSLSQVSELFKRCSSSLRSLILDSCPN